MGLSLAKYTQCMTQCMTQEHNAAINKNQKLLFYMKTPHKICKYI